MCRFQKWNTLLTILILGITATSAVLLASTLDQVNLQRGIEVSLPQQIVEPNPGASIVGLSDMPGSFAGFYRIVSRVFFWVIIPILAIIYFASPGNRRRKILLITLFIAIIVLAPPIMQLLTQNAEFEPVQQEVPLVPQAEPGIELAQPESVFAPASPIFGYIVTALIIIPVGIFLYILYSRNKSNDDVDESIQQKTDQALTALDQGQPIENVVIQLYSDMCNYLNQKRGIQRKSYMTPREFQSDLAKYGIPADASNSLTRFFEAARYGNKSFDINTQNQAVQCLVVIKESAANFETH